MMSRLLALVASATETRAVLPVVRTLRQRGHTVDIRHLGGLGQRNASDLMLAEEGRSRSVFSTVHLNSNVAARRYDGLLLANDNLAVPRWHIQAFARLGKPSVVVQEGLTSWRQENAETRRPLPIAVDKIWHHSLAAAVNGRLEHVGDRARRLLRGGSHRVEPYGGGKADVLCVATEEDRYAARQLTGSRTRVEVTGIPGLICSSSSKLAVPAVDESVSAVIISSPVWQAGYGTELAYEKFLSDAMAAAESSGKIASVSLRRHPSELKARGERNDESLEDCLRSVDLCLGAWSTALVQALMLGRVVVAVGAEGYFDEPSSHFPWHRYAFRAPAVGDIPSVLSAVTREAVSLKLAAFREDWGRCVDGLAHERVADVLEDQLT